MIIIIIIIIIIIAGDIDVNGPDMPTDESALPDIYVEEDLKRIQGRNKEIVKKNFILHSTEKFSSFT